MDTDNLKAETENAAVAAGAEENQGDVKILDKIQIRATLDIIEKFKELATNCGFKTQGAALAGFIKAYELANAQSLMVDRQTEIDNFKMSLLKVEEAYIHSLELFENVKEVVKSDFEKSLQDKNNSIQHLIEQNKEVIEKIKSLNYSLSTSETIINDETGKNERLEMELAEYKKREKILTDSFSRLNPKMEQLEASIQTLQQENKRLLERNNELEQQTRTLNETLSRAEHEYISKAKADLQELEVSRKEVQELKQQVINLQPYYNDWRSKNPQG